MTREVVTRPPENAVRSPRGRRCSSWQVYSSPDAVLVQRVYTYTTTAVTLAGRATPAEGGLTSSDARTRAARDYGGSVRCPS